MCNKQVNTNKGYYLYPDTILGIYYVHVHTGYIVREGAPHFNHNIWCIDLILSDADVRFTTHGRIFYLPKPSF